MREARHSNNVSCLRPNANSDYFGNTEMDERSNLRLKNETKITKVRNTMAPSTSNSQQSLGVHMHASYLRVGKPGSSSGLMAPSKTPTLYDNKKHSQPFLNSDLQKNLHLYRQNDSSNTSLKKYTTSTKATSDYNRSRTALQSRLQKVSAG